MSDVTHILSQIESGDPVAAEQLLPLVYDELRKLAAAKLAQEKPGQTLQATALVHEAYVRLVTLPSSAKPNNTDQSELWNSRGHFFAAAAEAMRRILVERARRKAGPEQGANRPRVSLDEYESVDERPAEVLAVHEALEALAAESPAKADLVKLRYFVGMSHQEAADALGISRATADRYWAYAKAFLYASLEDAQKILRKSPRG
jgi:RNA polymerase sigma factor (TIGR02999 family)